MQAAWTTRTGRRRCALIQATLPVSVRPQHRVHVYRHGCPSDRRAEGCRGQDARAGDGGLRRSTARAARTTCRTRAPACSPRVRQPVRGRPAVDWLGAADRGRGPDAAHGSARRPAASIGSPSRSPRSSASATRREGEGPDRGAVRPEVVTVAGGAGRPRRREHRLEAHRPGPVERRRAGREGQQGGAVRRRSLRGARRPGPSVELLVRDAAAGGAAPPVSGASRCGGCAALSVGRGWRMVRGRGGAAGHGQHHPVPVGGDAAFRENGAPDARVVNPAAERRRTRLEPDDWDQAWPPRRGARARPTTAGRTCRTEPGTRSWSERPHEPAAPVPAPDRVDGREIAAVDLADAAPPAVHRHASAAGRLEPTTPRRPA